MRFYKLILLALLASFCAGCMQMYGNIPNYESFYYDDWYGYFSSEIKWLRNNEVYQFSIGYDRPSVGQRQGYTLPDDQVPVLPDFIRVEVEGVSFTLNELTPELASKIAFLGPRKAGFLEYGDSISYMAKELDFKFYNGKLVHLHHYGTNVVFKNTRTGESGRFPMSVRKMKSIFGKPSRTKKKVVL
jgi:hypothetical protein